MRLFSYLLACLIAFPCYAGTGNENLSISPGTQTEAADNIGTGAWVNVANAKVVDTSVATSQLKVGWRTNSLDYTANTISGVNANYETILTGFTITVRALTDDVLVPLTLHVQMLNGIGVLIGTAETIQIANNTLTDYTLGGETDLWNQITYITVASLGKNFGWRVWVTNDDTGATGNSATVSLDGHSSLAYYYRRRTLSSTGAGL